MHFTVDSKNKVSGMHIEMWDEIALGPVMAKKMNSYAGKSLQDFLKFVLKQKLFLKLQMFYMMKGQHAIYFWASSACLGQENANTLMRTTKSLGLKNCKYAEIHLKIKGKENPFVPVLVEDVLAAVYQQCGYDAEVIELEMSAKDIKDISIAFNVARNKQHIIRNRMKVGGVDKGMFMNMNLKGLRFVGIDKNNSLEILDDKVLAKFSKKDAEKYVAIVSTQISDEKDKEEFERVLARVQKVAPASADAPGTAGKPAKKEAKKKETKEKQEKEGKKGFFSRFFKK